MPIRVLRRGALSLLLLATACGGGSGGSSSSDGVEVTDAQRATSETLVMPTDYVDIAMAAAEAERASRALLVAEVVPTATAEDVAALDAAVAGALAEVRIDMTRPLGQSAGLGLPVLQGTSSMAVAVGLPFKFQEMATPGREEEGSGSNRTVVTVEGSRLTVEMSATITDTVDGVGVTLEVSGTASGDVCPDADGRVVIEIELQERVSAAGATVRSTMNATATATVGEDASVQSFSVDVRSGIDVQAPDGSNGFIEYTSTVRLGDEGWTRTSQDVTRDRRGSSLKSAPAMRDALEDLARLAAAIALEGARERWQGGFCVVVEAPVPGTVRPSSVTSIDVHVKQRFEGVELDAPVEVTLRGKASVDPNFIPEAPGTVTYTAPPEKEQRATLDFVSTSRRGIGKLSADVTTGAKSYHAVGGADDFQGEGDICDLSAPFTISGGGVTVTFTPATPSSGSYSYSGSLEGFAVQGTGRYTVQLSDAGGTITASGEGSVETPIGVVSAAGQEVYALTPIESC